MNNFFRGGSPEFPARVPGGSIHIDTDYFPRGVLLKTINGSFVSPLAIQGKRFKEAKTFEVPGCTLVDPTQPLRADIEIRDDRDPSRPPVVLPHWFAPWQFRRSIFETQIIGAIWDTALQRYLVYAEPGSLVELKYFGPGQVRQVELLLTKHYQKSGLTFTVPAQENLQPRPFLSIVVDELDEATGWTRWYEIEALLIPQAVEIPKPPQDRYSEGISKLEEAVTLLKG